MADVSQIKEHMEVVGADGVHVGTVDSVDGGRIKLTKRDSGEDASGAPGGAQSGRHHYLDAGLIARVEGNQVHLTEDAATAAAREQEGA